MSDNYFKIGNSYNAKGSISLWVYNGISNIGNKNYHSFTAHNETSYHPVSENLRNIYTRYPKPEPKVKQVVKWQVESGDLYNTEEIASQVQRRHELEKLIDEKLFLREVSSSDIIAFMDDNKQEIINYLKQD